MSRLPTVGGDTDNWGTVLNDYLTTTATGGAALSASSSVSATTISVAVVPIDLKVGSIVSVDAGTADCELRTVTAISGSTITVNAALERSHAASAYVAVAADAVIHPNLFGCKGDNVTDDWQGLQRMFYQANKLTNSLIYGPTINGGGLTYRVTQPVTFSKHTLHNMQFNAYTTFAPADANNAMLMTCSMSHFQFTATASDDTFVATGGVFPNVNEPLVFNNMYGETLPGGVTAGRVYYVKTRADSTHATVSVTEGGTTLNVSSDGAGWVAGQIGDLTKIWWRDVSVNVAYADLSGLIMGAQQPADMYRTRVNMTVACTRTTYGIAITNCQIARLYNTEFVVNGATNVVGLAIGVPVVRGISDTNVSGVHVQDTNFDGATDSGQTHIVIGGGQLCDNVVLSGDTWIEGPGDAGIRLDRSVRGADLGHIYMSGTATNGVIYETATAGNASWRVGQIIFASANKTIVKTVDGVLFKTAGSSDNIAADSCNVMHGMRRLSSGVMAGLELEGRMYVSSSSSVTAAWNWETIDMDATGGTRTLTLPSCVGVATMRFTVRKKDSSGNAVTVATTSSQEINGSTTYSLASQYKYVTVESTGAAWIVVANN